MIVIVRVTVRVIVIVRVRVIVTVIVRPYDRFDNPILASITELALHRSFYYLLLCYGY